MSVLLPISDIIQIGDVSTYLSANDTHKKSIYGGNITKPVPPIQISMVTDGLRWGNTSNVVSEASLRSTANYLYWLCGLYQLQAQNIISGPGGGSVVPITPISAMPNPYDFEVTNVSTPIADGNSSVFLPLFVGYNIEFARNGVIQNTTNLGIGSSFYTWNRVSGFFSFSQAATSGELFRISPV